MRGRAIEGGVRGNRTDGHTVIIREKDLLAYKPMPSGKEGEVSEGGQGGGSLLSSKPQKKKTLQYYRIHPGERRKTVEGRSFGGLREQC